MNNIKELWIARKEDLKLDGITLEKGSLYVSVNEPHIENDPLRKWWCATGDYGYLPSSLFPEITFDNSPKKIKIELL